jgi:hypothetical protein
MAIMGKTEMFKLIWIFVFRFMENLFTFEDIKPTFLIPKPF